MLDKPPIKPPNKYKHNVFCYNLDMRCKFFIIATTILLFSGCAAKPIYLQNGKEGYVFSCVASSGVCEQQAGATCKQNGYTIVEDTLTTNKHAFIGIFGGGSNETTIRKILIHCN